MEGTQGGETKDIRPDGMADGGANNFGGVIELYACSPINYDCPAPRRCSKRCLNIRDEHFQVDQTVCRRAKHDRRNIVFHKILLK